jgi:hypothetical protein
VNSYGNRSLRREIIGRYKNVGEREKSGRQKIIKKSIGINVERNNWKG